MAVSKHTRGPDPDTNQLFQRFFKHSKVSKERKHAWQDAMHHTGSGIPPLRFPVYECLYSLNVHAQKMVELLEGVASRFGLSGETSRYHQSLIQYVRADVSRDILESMAAVEHTESWLFESLRHAAERKLFDRDKVYFEVREREEERSRQGLPPRIKFLKATGAAKKPSTRTATKHNRSG